MQVLFLTIFKYLDATLNRDRSRDLLIIGHCEAFKHEDHLFIINTISVLTVL
jgi:hypothetical protein